VIEQRRQEPREDLISALLAAELDGEKLTHEDLLGFCVLLLVAGNETTTNLIGNAVRCLLEHPEPFERLRRDPSLWGSAVEEVLRYRSPVQATIRMAAEDVELRGKTIKEGEPIVVWLASANRDAAEFPDPDRFDITRQPNRHLAFGLGIHFCLGAPLARQEANIALKTITRRLPRLRRADDGKLEPLEGFIMNGLMHLPLAFDAA
jgi:cytochrome P450